MREQTGVAVGDVFEAKAQDGKIVFAPKSIVDRGIARSIAEIKAGLGFGPHATHKQFLASLHEEAKKVAAKKKLRA